VSQVWKQRQGHTSASTIRKDLFRIRGVRLNAEVSGCKCGVFRNTGKGSQGSAQSPLSRRRRTCGTAHGSRNSQPRKTSAAGHESVHAHPCRPAMRRPLGGQRRKPLPRLSTSPQVRSNYPYPCTNVLCCATKRHTITNRNIFPIPSACILSCSFCSCESINCQVIRFL
jgi:hypothetical protein